MSFSNINIGEKASDYKTSEVFNSYGRIDMVLGEDDEGNVIIVSYPDIPDDRVAGRIMTVDMPMCTDTALARNAATRIYNSLMHKNPTAFQYQPQQTQEALVDPSIEFGDSIDINKIHSGFYTRKVTFGRLMPHDLSSPADEEINHEYPYQDSQQRQITRTNKEFKASLHVTNQAITAEVSRASAAEGNLSNRITVTANGLTAEINRASAAEGNLSTRITATANGLTAEINRASAEEGRLSTRITANANGLSAEITARSNADSSLSTRITANAGEISARVTKTGGNSATFGWTLDTTGHSWYSGSRQVMKVDSSGLTVEGKITATSGQIGGFSIGRNELMYNDQPWGGTKTTGIYIGSNGIQCGNAAGNYFQVTNQGQLNCNNITATGLQLKGTLTFYNNDGTVAGTLDASSLRKGAAEAYSKYSSWDGTKGTVDSNSSNWTSGYNWGSTFNNATKEQGGSAVGYFQASRLSCQNIGVGSTATIASLKVGGHSCGLGYITDKSGTSRKVMIWT